MPSSITEILELLGFTTPFVYAVATYGFFHWLDKEASGPAKKAISGWLEPKEYDKAAVQAAILEIFDRVYTKPLLGWRAFFRSALITLVVTAVCIFEFGNLFTIPAYLIESPLVIGTILISSILTNIFADYCALFIIRRMLARGMSVVTAMTVGPLFGMILVFIVNVLRTWLSLEFLSQLIVTSRSVLRFILDNFLSFSNVAFHVSYFGIINFIINLIYDTFTFQTNVYSALNVAAFLVHLWLPFFALSVGLLKALNYILLATKRVQWFIKRGRDHPLDALGFVAAPIVFLVTVAAQMLTSR
jgi:hypothetical protein